MRITDRSERDRWRQSNIVSDLTDDANGISDAIAILRKPAEHDTDDKVCAAAVAALEDTTGYLDDVITALNDGRLAEPGEAG
jgi:hypothetical protein